NLHRRYTHQANPGVGQFAFHQRFYLFAKRLPHPPAMMLQPTLLHNPTSGKTVENIRKLDAGVAPSSAWMRLLCTLSSIPAKYGGNSGLPSMEKTARGTTAGITRLC